MAMKINERVLSGIATSSSPVDREGWLNKKEQNKSFVRRWFVLKGNLLFYFDKRGDKEPIGVIVLVGYRVELDEDDKQFTFKIIFHGMQNKAYILGADSQDSMELWMKAITCAGFDYMKLMVAELQRQIDEIEEATPHIKDVPKVPPREQRHNPFNKLSDATTSKQGNGALPQQSIGPKKISFSELHAYYGEPILIDREEWLNRKEEEESKLKPLIEL